MPQRRKPRRMPAPAPRGLSEVLAPPRGKLCLPVGMMTLKVIDAGNHSVPAIREEVRRRAGFRNWGPKASPYRTLESLEREGFVAPAEGGMYLLTEAGTAALEQYERELVLISGVFRLDT